MALSQAKDTREQQKSRHNERLTPFSCGATMYECAKRPSPKGLEGVLPVAPSTVFSVEYRRGT